MKRFLILLCFVAFTATATTCAQEEQKGGKKYKEQVEALRVGIFTRLMELSAEEGQKFWPLYEEHSEKVHKLHRRERDLYRKISNNEATLQDVQQWVGIEQEKGELMKQGTEQFLKILTPNQVGKLFVAEEMLMREVMKAAYNK